MSSKENKDDLPEGVALYVIPKDPEVLAEILLSTYSRQALLTLHDVICEALHATSSPELMN
jgi:hypothetical protein